MHEPDMFAKTGIRRMVGKSPGEPVHRIAALRGALHPGAALPFECSVFALLDWVACIEIQGRPQTRSDLRGQLDRLEQDSTKRVVADRVGKL